MKRTLLAVALSLGMSSFAHAGHNSNWVLPAIIGGAIVYEAMRPNTVYIQQAPVYQQPVYIPQPVYIQQPVYIPAPPVHVQVPGYRWENILDRHCNCYRTVLVPY